MDSRLVVAETHSLLAYPMGRGRGLVRIIRPYLAPASARERSFMGTVMGDRDGLAMIGPLPRVGERLSIIGDGGRQYLLSPVVWSCAIEVDRHWIVDLMFRAFRQGLPHRELAVEGEEESPFAAIVGETAATQAMAREEQEKYWRQFEAKFRKTTTKKEELLAA